MAPRVERRLAAILAADVVGYSRLVGADEAGTIARLKALRQEFIEPLIAEYRGRVVKLMGDGALVEFASAVDAVECAVAIQHGVAEREAAVPEDRRIAFPHRHQRRRHHRRGRRHPRRRRQRRRAPRGAWPSRADLRRPQRPQPGQGKLASPSRRWASTGSRTSPSRSRSIGSTWTRPGRAHHRTVWTRQRWQAAAASVALLLVFGQAVHGTRCDHRRRHRTRPLRKADWPAAQDKPALPLPDKPSIVVLPFTNLSGDPEQEYFADAITEDIITGLARFRDCS